jgi:hypothetical protein
MGESGNLHLLSRHILTRKNGPERKQRRSYDTSLEYSTVNVVTSQVADLIGGALRYLAATHSCSGEFSDLLTDKRNGYN